MNEHTKIPRELDAFCERWGGVELALFGSALRDELGPESDVDILVSFNDEARPTLLDMVHMEDELTELFGRPADLLERDAIEASCNTIRRKAILGSAETIYAAK
ncbi:MAG: nucleotidyltransferase family protein [Gemmatimonadota bacterium]|nr:nucleotidyltransferase family protein [Gemmatimonadota bacterium]